MTTLRDLKVGQHATVTHISTSNRRYRQKLLAMGILPDTTVSVTRVAPLGDPIELCVRGYQLSLRKKESELVKVVIN